MLSKEKLHISHVTDYPRCELTGTYFFNQVSQRDGDSSRGFGQFAVSRSVPCDELLAAEIRIGSKYPSHFQGNATKLKQISNFALRGDDVNGEVAKHAGQGVKFSSSIGVNNPPALILLLKHRQGAHTCKFICHDLQAKNHGCRFRVRCLGTCGTFGHDLTSRDYQRHGNSANCSYRLSPRGPRGRVPRHMSERRSEYSTECKANNRHYRVAQLRFVLVVLIAVHGRPRAFGRNPSMTDNTIRAAVPDTGEKPRSKYCYRLTAPAPNKLDNFTNISLRLVASITHLRQCDCKFRPLTFIHWTVHAERQTYDLSHLPNGRTQNDDEFYKTRRFKAVKRNCSSNSLKFLKLCVVEVSLGLANISHNLWRSQLIYDISGEHERPMRYLKDRFGSSQSLVTPNVQLQTTRTPARPGDRHNRGSSLHPRSHVTGLMRLIVEKDRCGDNESDNAKWPFPFDLLHTASVQF